MLKCVASLGRAIGGFEEACEPLEKGRDQLQNPLRLFVVRDQHIDALGTSLSTATGKVGNLQTAINKLKGKKVTVTTHYILPDLSLIHI